MSLKGASLVETLVASVIFLTVFLIAMNSLTDIARIRFSGISPVDMEEAVRVCMGRFEEGVADKEVYHYMWGIIEIEAVPYKAVDGLLDVKVIAKGKNGCIVLYRYLICRDLTQI